MMSGTSLSFAPLLPWPALLALALAIAAVTGLGLWRRARGILWRGLMLGLGVLALANPVVIREQRQPLDDVAVLLADRSPSQTVGERPQQLDQALTKLRAELKQIEGLEVVEATTSGDGKGGTRLFSTLGDDAARDRPLAARGRPDALRRPGPRRAQEPRCGPDRRADAPLADRPARRARPAARGRAGPELRHGRRSGGDHVPGRRPAGRRVLASRSRSRCARTARSSSGSRSCPGVSRSVPFQLARAGQTVLEVEAAPAPGEVTTLNNRQVFFVNGVRDRLRVLLVSGQPYSGLRVWRNLLKADPAVDLVHFTILRPPEKQDGTPIRELALIAFPSRELFEVKLKEFDLVIFDRYSRRGLLPLAYLDNVARYVENGGGLLEIAGPEFAHPLSLYRTPLAHVLPARPTGIVYERGFTPTLTDLGQRHPVTAGLAEGLESDKQQAEGGPPWGRWFRQVDVEAEGSQVLMSGAADRPLLALNRVGKGRVAQLLSDQVWLWARGFEGGGPQGLLLRRLVHWLMQEPELEEEALRAEPGNDSIAIERRSLHPEAETATVTAPSGQTSQVKLEPSGQGLAHATVPAKEAGLYRISDSQFTTYAAVRPIGAEELSDMRATPDRMAPLVEASGGAVHWLADGGAPEVRKVAAGRALSGRNWVGLSRNERYLVTGASQLPLLPAVLALMLLLGTLGFAWYREGR